MIFGDFDFEPLWNHWGDRKNAPRPPDGWNQAGQRPEPKYFPARAVNGWIKVGEEPLK